MTQRRVTLHGVAGAKKALDVCQLVERLFLEGKRVVVFVGDGGRAAILNDYLWTFSQPSFVPHCLWDGASDVEEPVVLVVGEVANPNGAGVLVVADRLRDPAAAAAFKDVHDVVARSAEDEGKAEAWRAAGFEVREAGAKGRRSEP